MMQPLFLLIAYNVDEPKTYQHARRKYVDHKTFSELQEEFFKEVYLEDDLFMIVERRTALISGDFSKTMLIIIDVKRKTVTDEKTVEQNKVLDQGPPVDQRS